MADAPAATRATETPAWQQALACAIKSPDELLARLGLAQSELADQVDRESPFPLRVPESYLAKMVPGRSDDPLLRQVLPLRAERAGPSAYRKDPLEETRLLHAPGLLHKYHARALLTVTGTCAVHCRYCFRRHFPYAEAGASPREWRHALEALRAMPDIKEIILSGGDPLAVSDQRLGHLVNELAGIPHLERLRIHTRLPVVLPERITDALVGGLTATRLASVVVVHVNHPQEIDAAFGAAMHALRSAGITLLNQAVLLRGINDRAELLEALSERLFTAGVLPYYLHALDPVEGAAHFDAPDTLLAELLTSLRNRLPGYLVPRGVREIPGAPSKTPLA